MPYLAPGLVALAALLSVITSVWMVRIPKCAACCVATATIATLPFMFLLVGGLLFPMLLIADDVCTSGLNVAYNYVALAPKSVCGGLSLGYTLPGPTSSGACDYSVIILICVRVCVFGCVLSSYFVFIVYRYLRECECPFFGVMVARFFADVLYDSDGWGSFLQMTPPRVTSPCSTPQSS